MEYRIKIDGDSLEKEAWDELIQNYFPNYEIFWSKFVVPRTNRPYNIGFKQNVPYGEIRISMLNYGVLYQLYAVYKNKSNWGNREVFENSYIRLCGAIDQVEEFLFWLFVYSKQISLDEEINNLPKKVLIKKNNAKKRIEQGINYSIPLFNKITIVQTKLNNEKIKQFIIESNKIRHYRNIIAHSWPIFWKNNKVPKETFLSKNRDWKKIYFTLAKNDNEYVEADKQLKSDFFNILELINSIFYELITDFYKFKPGYQKEKTSIIGENNQRNTSPKSMLASECNSAGIKNEK